MYPPARDTEYQKDLAEKRRIEKERVATERAAAYFLRMAESARRVVEKAAIRAASDVMPIGEVAAKLGMHQQQIWKLANENRIPHVRVSAESLLPGEELAAKNQIYRFSRRDIAEWYENELKVAAIPKEAKIPSFILAYLEKMAEAHPEETPLRMKDYLTAARGEVVAKRGKGRPTKEVRVQVAGVVVFQDQELEADQTADQERTI